MAEDRRRRRVWTDGEKRRIVGETLEPGASVSVVARRHNVNANLVFTWRRDPRFNGEKDSEVFLPVQLLAKDEPPRRHDDGGVVDAGREAENPSMLEGIEIDLDHGMRLRFGRGIAEEPLIRIIRALRRSP